MAFILPSTSIYENWYNAGLALTTHPLAVTVNTVANGDPVLGAIIKFPTIGGS